MRGELLRVLGDTWHAIWHPLSEHADAPPDLFAELFREFVSEPQPPEQPPPPPADAYDETGNLISVEKFKSLTFTVSRDPNTRNT